ncbi:RDD family protein [Hydrogenovibrio sp. SC-1]|uniref:RDD family protein n=1 Tax=Hydrogenovibrio sp. SC-1 TaxID=2065820 RepID=UPI000C7A164B|nr:RDD family protein [Hydrogenovibrio sp. SC-1]PLA74106.1 RDD family protein [Hydrogenovibrio sp. SC-1]
MLSFKILFAFFYDALLLIALWFVSAIPFVLWQGSGFEQDPVKLLAFQTYLLAITYFYLSYFWTLNGQTPGLRVWHLRLLTNSDHLMNRYQANLRFLSGILLFTIGWIGLFIPPVKQTLQDRISKTKIVAT